MALSQHATSAMLGTSSYKKNCVLCSADVVDCTLLDVLCTHSVYEGTFAWRVKLLNGNGLIKKGVQNLIKRALPKSGWLFLITVDLKIFCVPSMNACVIEHLFFSPRQSNLVIKANLSVLPSLNCLQPFQIDILRLLSQK